MKKLITAASLMFASALTDNSYAEKDWRETCASVSKLAEVVMTSRQKGMSMSELMKIANGNELNEKIVMEAFETSRFTSAEMQQRKIEDFRDKWYLSCAKGIRK